MTATQLVHEISGEVQPDRQNELFEELRRFSVPAIVVGHETLEQIKQADRQFHTPPPQLHDVGEAERAVTAYFATLEEGSRPKFSEVIFSITNGMPVDDRFIRAAKIAYRQNIFGPNNDPRLFHITGASEIIKHSGDTVLEKMIGRMCFGQTSKTRGKTFFSREGHKVSHRRYKI